MVGGCVCRPLTVRLQARWKINIDKLELLRLNIVTIVHVFCLKNFFDKKPWPPLGFYVDLSNVFPHDAQAEELNSAQNIHG